MASLPEGTVTFLFTDIEGSTRLLQELGDGYPAVLDTHRRLLRAAFAKGTEVGTEGDSFFVAFPVATDAVAAAVEAQRALAGHRGRPVTRSASGWACTPVAAWSVPMATSASTSTAPRGSPPPGMAGRWSCPRRRSP